MNGLTKSQSRPDANPSAKLLSELAEMTRSHSRYSRSTYHGTNSASGNTVSLPASAIASPVQSGSPIATTPQFGSSTPGTPRSATSVDSQHNKRPSDHHSSDRSVADHRSDRSESERSLPVSPNEGVAIRSSARTTASTNDKATTSTSIQRSLSSASSSSSLSSSSSASSPSVPSSLVGQTDVDKMMLLVQSQSEKDELSHHHAKRASGIFTCSVEGCGKTFRQRAHLHTHMRSHTGERPYICPFEGCNKTFSQRCNLRTHIRSHTGERPYVCDICGRAFSQQGNMRHHRLIHYNEHPLVCKLEGCNKHFNQLGNLKAHQNSAHKHIVQAFMEKLQSGIRKEDLPVEEQEMFDYFCQLYKNSNRGIRGRGKGTKTIAYRHPTSGSPALTPQSSVNSTPQEKGNQAFPAFSAAHNHQHNHQHQHQYQHHQHEHSHVHDHNCKHSHSHEHDGPHPQHPTPPHGMLHGTQQGMPQQDSKPMSKAPSGTAPQAYMDGKQNRPRAPPSMEQPPMGQLPVGQSPIGQPPVVGQPPMGQPPVGQPPMGQPPVGQPPVGQPPVGQPPMGQPPMGQPPMGQQQMAPLPMGQMPVAPSGQYPVGQPPAGNLSRQPQSYMVPQTHQKNAGAPPPFPQNMPAHMQTAQNGSEYATPFNVNQSRGLNVPGAMNFDQSQDPTRNNYTAPPSNYMSVPAPPQGIPQGIPQGMPQGMPQGIPQGMPQGMPQGFLSAPPQGMPPALQQGAPQGPPSGPPPGHPSAGPPPGVPPGGPQGYPPQGAPFFVPGRDAGEGFNSRPRELSLASALGCNLQPRPSFASLDYLTGQPIRPADARNSIERAGEAFAEPFGRERTASFLTGLNTMPAPV